jgi:hypothetical protein
MKLNTKLTTLVLSIIVLILVLTLFYKSTKQENFENTVNALPSNAINNTPESAYEPPNVTMDISPNVELTGIGDLYAQEPNQEQENIIKKIIQNGNPCDMKAQLDINFSKMEALQNDMKELKQSFGLKKKN